MIELDRHDFYKTYQIPLKTFAFIKGMYFPIIFYA